MNPVRPEPVEGLNGIYVTHPTGECEETRSCFDWAQHERVSSRPTDFFRFIGYGVPRSNCCVQSPATPEWYECDCLAAVAATKYQATKFFVRQTPSAPPCDTIRPLVCHSARYPGHSGTCHLSFSVQLHYPVPLPCETIQLLVCHLARHLCLRDT